MKVLVFIPGTMGTALVAPDGEELWPPQLLETQFGYRRMDRLLDPAVQPGAIIAKVACFDFYGSLLEQFAELGWSETSATQRLLPFAYDWRLDLEVTAERLAAQLDALHAQGADEITLVAHSMGGLIARLLVEGAHWAGRPWQGAVRTLVTIATPHQGAPLALARVLGLDSDLGFSGADFRRMTNDRRYPSAYQLLPAPSEACCWDQSSLTLGAVDLYDAAHAAALGLDPVLLERARWLHDALAAAAPRPQLRRFTFAATGHETVTRINVFRRDGRYPVEDMVLTRTEDGGDGTVPLWSALPHPGQRQVVVNEHSHAFCGMAFKRVLFRLLGRDIGAALEALQADEAQQLLASEGLRLSIASPVLRCGHEFELLLVAPMAVAPLQGRLLLQPLDAQGRPVPGRQDELARIDYQGPLLSTLRLRLPGLARPGPYQLHFEGVPAASQPLRFAVSQVPGA